MAEKKFQIRLLSKLVHKKFIRNWSMTIIKSLQSTLLTSRLCLGLITGAFLTIAPSSAVAMAQENPMDGFSEWAEKAQKDWGIPGFSMAVVKDGKMIFAEGFGKRDLANNLPFTTDTVSHIGSTTKAFVSMSLALLVDEGKINWDDKVTQHLPGFKLADPWVTRELNITDILSHRSGFKNHDLMWARGNDRKDSVKRMANIEQVSSMRTTWAYNNLGYLLAGEIIEAISGMEMEDFIKTRILTPLHMKATTLRWKNTKDLKMLTNAHNRVGLDGAVKVPYSNIDSAGGAGVMNSTVLDMSKWLQFLLSGGMAEDKRLVSEKNFEVIFKDHSIVNTPNYPATEQSDAHFMNYGLAWFIQDFEGRKLNMHTGSIGGLTAIMSFMPEENVGFVGLFNRSTSELRHAAMYEVMDRFTDGHSGKDWSGDIKSLYYKAWKAGENSLKDFMASQIKGTQPSLPLESYAGTYSHPVEGDVRVEVSDDDTLMVYMAPMISIHARHFHHDTFIMHDATLPAEVSFAGPVNFNLNVMGKVDSINLFTTSFKKIK
jgi:CubicO group peptidase (beta-lactamase class C family)